MTDWGLPRRDGSYAQTGLPGRPEVFTRTPEGYSRTVSAGRLWTMRGVQATGVCPECQCRVPVLRDGSPVRHWPHSIGRVRLVQVRGRSGYAPGTMQTVCAGSEVTVAGLIMVMPY